MTNYALADNRAAAVRLARKVAAHYGLTYGPASSEYADVTVSKVKYSTAYAVRSDYISPTDTLAVAQANGWLSRGECVSTWNAMTDEPGLYVTHGDAPAVAHNDYPHNPGSLYDCAACEAACHCLPDESECVFSGEHSGDATAYADAPLPDRTVRIPRGTRHLGSDSACREISESEGVREISDACAVTVASWWQSPRGPGEAFTRLVSFLPVSVSDLLAAVSWELSQITSQCPEAKRDRVALGMLATWGINRWRGESVAA